MADALQNLIDQEIKKDNERRKLALCFEIQVRKHGSNTIRVSGYPYRTFEDAYAHRFDCAPKGIVQNIEAKIIGIYPGGIYKIEWMISFYGEEEEDE